MSNLDSYINKKVVILLKCGSYIIGKLHKDDMYHIGCLNLDMNDIKNIKEVNNEKSRKMV